MKKFMLIALMFTFGFAAMAQPVVEFKVTKHDFGQIAEDGGKVIYAFSLTNTGDKDLFIKNVRTPCGCTSPKWPKEPVKPGEDAVVQATFDPLHRPGVFNKVLTVETNAEPKNYYVTIMGEVSPRKKTVLDRFPMKNGRLRYKLPQVNMGKVYMHKKDTVHFPIFNQSMQAVTISKVIAPDHIKVEIPRSTIAPTTIGKIIVEYDALTKGDLGFVTDEIELITNDDRNPRKKLYVIAEIEQYIPALTPKQLAVAPKIVALEDELDLGEVAANKKVKGKFVLKNDGVNNLQLIRIKPECGCTSTIPGATEAAEGEEIVLEIEFDPSDYNGLVVKTIDVYSNDPVNPKLTLRVRAIVDPSLN